MVGAEVGRFLFPPDVADPADRRGPTVETGELVAFPRGAGEPEQRFVDFVLVAQTGEVALGGQLTDRRTSAAAFTLEEYRSWVRRQPGWANLTDAQLGTDLTSVHAASDPRLVRCGAAGRKWGRIAADEAHPGVVALHDEAVAGTRATVGEKYQVYCDALVHCVSLTPRPTAQFRSSPAMNVTWSTASGPQPVTEGDLSLAREAIRTAVTSCTAYQLANGEWRQFFTEVVSAPQKFPQKMVGDMVEELAAADLTRAGYNATQVGVVVAQDPAIPELDAPARSGFKVGVDEVEGDDVSLGRMTRMVVGDDRLRQRKPFVPALCHALGADELDNRRAHVQVLLFRQVLSEESENLAPAIHSLLGPVEWPVPIKDAVAGTVVAMELIALSVPLELRFVLVHLLGAGRTIVVAEDADQRAA
jgi:hypothetical protein